MLIYKIHVEYTFQDLNQVSNQKYISMSKIRYLKTINNKRKLNIKWHPSKMITIQIQFSCIHITTECHFADLHNGGLYLWDWIIALWGCKKEYNLLYTTSPFTSNNASCWKSSVYVTQHIEMDQLGQKFKFDFLLYP